MKVLIVEDNQQLAERIKLVLGKHFVVDVVHTGEEGLQRAPTVDYAAVVLDLGLPDMSGKEVCEQLRRQHCNAPILILTGVTGIQSVVDLLDAGADDYLSKPFNSEELVARMQALARRSREAPQPRKDDRIVLGDLVINLANREVRRGGELVPLRRKEFEILQYLVINQGRAMSRAMIINHAWETSKESWQGTVDVHIKRLRDKLDRPFDDKPIIKTAYGIGYMVDSTRKHTK